MTKITIIGGPYLRGVTFVRDIFSTHKLKGSTIALEDIVEKLKELIK